MAKMLTQQGTIFKIKRFALHDGPGIRTTVFLKGCPLSCWWCHNPEGQAPSPQPMGRKVELPDGATEMLQEAIGRSVTAGSVMAEIEKDLIFYDDSGGGVTFSGGEPFLQKDFLGALLRECRRKEIHTAVDTSGFIEASVLTSLLEFIDLFLFDIKIMDDSLHRRFTGVSNQPVLDNFNLLCAQGKPVFVRLPLIPGITDTRRNIRSVTELVDRCGNVERIDILPYHRIASEKYNRLGMPCRMPDTMPPTAADIEKIRQFFEETGRPVTVGG